MSLQTEHGTVEEHEPVKPHLRIEVSPVKVLLHHGRMGRSGYGWSDQGRWHRSDQSCFGAESAPDFSRHRPTVHTWHLDLENHDVSARRSTWRARRRRPLPAGWRIVRLEEQRVGFDQIRIVVSRSKRSAFPVDIGSYRLLPMSRN
jgi:hypothetical protein